MHTNVRAALIALSGYQQYLPTACPNHATTAVILQAVAVLKFSGDGAVLLSGGEDTVASAWLLMDLLDASAAQGAGQAPQTFHSW